MARPGKLVRDAPAYRRMAAILFVRRNESAVYFEDAIDVTETLAFIDDWNAKEGAPKLTLFSLVLHATARTLHEHPRLNRFVAGRKLYQRDGVWLTFAAKKSMAPEAPLVEVKREFPEGESLHDFLAGQEARLRDARGEKESKLDREVRWFLKVPHLLLIVLVRLVRVLDFFNLLPRSFITGDPFYASAFLANLGSVGGAAAFHHLYEYGDIPLFVVLGRVREEVVAVRGEAVVRKIARVRFSYDERIEDGFNAIRALATLREKLEQPSTFVSRP